MNERDGFYLNVSQAPARHPFAPTSATVTSSQSGNYPTTMSTMVQRTDRGSANSLVKTKEDASGESIWYNKCTDYVHKIIRYYRCNDMSELTPLMIHFINTIRDMCIDSNPVSVNIIKRVQTDEEIVRHLIGLQKELRQNSVAESIDSDSNIFQPSFVLNSLPAYAQKFYNGGADTLGKDALNEAAKQLSLAVQYMVSEAVTCSIPIPLPFDQQLANNYVTLLLKRATLPDNVQEAVKSRSFVHINMINDLINSVIDDLFAGGGNYYYYVLNEKNRARVVGLKENVGFLAPLSASADIFNYMSQLATRHGKRPDMFENAAFLTSAANAINSPAAHLTQSACQKSLSQLAAQCETLTRFIFMIVKQTDADRLLNPPRSRAI
ncbi:occlusion-derived virus envelope glycoprotein [Anticarsia gemmatalis nucleopolyhedrovirus]|uniref:Occlusion-derived virus envelope glycoprotein n=1 Tax=Anticarsia gemmatalis multiple nucleopolyhedrovirus TaxID=268591 RepID=A0A0S3IZK8_9ABAC|nr:occlusion-derived virus envelope glycoprotein [Anticarsia gemmatalis nucleopolyhedrovirus]ABI13862.1 occlusion-derived virus envelope glycoprotein [Anticarsia gemmatalis multiple nucleopolyhedrovirus]ALR69888.1 occlusion-derived virus envelope glycoprotein [Anticarsia gemmatalis multiple nucleopolyhedrovirus]ALR70046.1 occlusion-derived virus envelope glycoprotein [Anticarsia gemmatalis multiple nucleopolyhedrovirus]ALR70360.1 occlusion-derived virus envelope glycoprotein [Anticarsia gemmata